jgi:hypothetical protein
MLRIASSVGTSTDTAGAVSTVTVAAGAGTVGTVAAGAGRDERERVIAIPFRQSAGTVPVDRDSMRLSEDKRNSSDQVFCRNNRPKTAVSVHLTQ